MRERDKNEVIVCSFIKIDQNNKQKISSLISKPKLDKISEWNNGKKKKVVCLFAILCWSNKEPLSVWENSDSVIFTVADRE